MADSFDFDAFISSPSQGDTLTSNPINNNITNNITNNINGGNSNSEPNSGTINDSSGGRSLIGPTNDMMSSFSDQGLDSGLAGGNLVSNGGMDIMGGSSLMSQSNSLMFGNYGDSFSNDIMESWDMNQAGGGGNSNSNDSGPGAPMNQSVLEPQQHGGATAPATAATDSTVDAPAVGNNAAGRANDVTASYRNQIAAHHSHLLGSNGSLTSKSTSAIPRVSTIKRQPPPIQRMMTVPNAAQANLSLQERRRLSRQAAKQGMNAPQQQHQQQAAMAIFNAPLAGRGAKRGMDGDSGQISSSPQGVMPVHSRNVSFMNDSSGSSVSSGSIASPQKTYDSRSSSFVNNASGPGPGSGVGPGHGMPAPTLEPASPVFKGQYNTVSGEEVPTVNKYSTSGVDVLGILSRAITRPNPRISLGPVDLSCSFTISDASHPEQPLVYASETFCHLTGYTLHEILGKNCRFLQTPGVPLEAGTERQHTDNRAVEHLKRHLSTFRECQASLINYRKDGSPFINLVTVVPVSWSNPAQVDFLVGFQVDLVEQPGAILERKEDGSYVVNYRSINDPPPSATLGSDEMVKDADAEATKQAAIAADILDLIHGVGPCDAKQWSRVLLENSHDLIYVLSLKGTFLYVSPSVERILGYTAEEVIGKSISEFCHPSDVVPVFRELKDSTSNASIAAAASRNIRMEGVANPLTKGGGGQAGPRVNLIFRMRHKHDGHRWIESTGKLHLEQGKGRKVVISSGRPRPVYNLAWEHVRRGAEVPEPSFWSKLSIDGLFLSSTGPISEVLGCDSKDIFGRHMLELTNYEAAPSLLQALRSSQAMSVSHLMGDGVRNTSPVFSSFYPSSAAAGPALSTVFVHVQRASNESSWMMPNVAYPKGGPQPAFDVTGTSVDSLTSVFAELSTYRASSWVFEMHQLKNVNRRLKDEIRALRRQSRDHSGTVNGPRGLLGKIPPQSPSSGLGRRTSGQFEPGFGMPPTGSAGVPAMHQTASPIKRRPDHGHGHRQHLRPTAALSYLHASSSTDRGSSSSSSSEISPFPERPLERRSGSGDASDETTATTANSSGNTSEKDGSATGSRSGSDSRRGSGSAEASG
ncbi:hypothetical protein BCV70DRAFT_160976 [Testicularia cyperi]|uniref:PAS domain-containing protein n=1 Tax=Testicularia cyperi TaxID=1882483 RepID=A0A317XPP2_9BASI|nr:hypothetical protein BCV70DRAFT_160976 [Testicularia cyperi]